MTWPTTTDTGAEPQPAGHGAPRRGSRLSWQNLRDGAIRTWRTPPWRRGRVIAVVAILATLPLAFHRLVPNTPGNWGSFVETFLPWAGLVVPVLLICAAIRRSWTAVAATLVPIMVWVVMFGGFFMPGRGGGSHDLRVVSHNVNAVNTDPAGTARSLLKSNADVIALEELPEGAWKLYNAVLKDKYPNVQHEGTVAVWTTSAFPMNKAEAVDVGMGFTRALRTVIQTPKGDVAFYAVHLASVRFGASGFTIGERNHTIGRLAQALAVETAPHVVLAGDLNGTTDDRALQPITRYLRDAQDAAGTGMGFTWPESFPMAAIDHIMTRGMTAADAKVLGSTSSDHKPVQADLRLR
ncbi:endonuclease/exonuclease/phosphatase family protein [Embleya sp. NBC_00896]|uniref:endonuclease/exonuclease/phosphatase family protein n=1 Tax=Embleya sp. NBC_00896 TaxID=2975961 RepID=UPI003863D97F|nr:endonuclease/exonuclease/phosphatase family protein [Embleya sp. NBC_00896]